MSDASDHARGPLAESETGGAIPEVDVRGASGDEPGDGSPRRNSLWADAWRSLRRNPIFVLSALLVLAYTVLALFPGWFTDTSPTTPVDLLRAREGPTAEHWFGLDLQGRDYYTRVIYGARVSMIIGLFTVGVASLIALILGFFAGWRGGWIDGLLSRLTDIWFAFPLVLGALVVLSIVDNVGVFQVSGVLILFGWPTMMRIARSAVLSEKERDYVQAARALGAGDLRILVRHILPNAVAPVIVYATIAVGVIISAEATLSFLGVGLLPPSISWGLMISEAQNYVLHAPHLLLFPGTFLSVLVLAFIMMGDALRDALDPRLR